MITSLFGGLGFFETLMKAGGRVPRETHSRVRAYTALTVRPASRGPRSPEAQGDHDSKIKATAERSSPHSRGQA